MKRSRVLRLAAKLAHDRPACGCWAIYSQVAPYKVRNEAFEIFRRFKPHPMPRQPLGMPTWFGLVQADGPGHSERILALCFAAAIAEWEETHP